MACIFSILKSDNTWKWVHDKEKGKTEKYVLIKNNDYLKFTKMLEKVTKSWNASCVLLHS